MATKYDVEAMLDYLESSTDGKESHKKISEFRKWFASLDSEEKAEAQRKYRSARYPYVRFAKLMTSSLVNPASAVTGRLSSAAGKLMLIMAQNSQSAAIRFSVSELAALSHLSEVSVRKCLKEMCELKIIRRIEPPSNKTPATYEWNDRFVMVGTEEENDDFPDCEPEPVAYVSARKKLPVGGGKPMVTYLVATGSKKK